MENEIHDKLWKLIMEVDNHVARSYFCLPPAKKAWNMV